jgi:hypothetical protein
MELMSRDSLDSITIINLVVLSTFTAVCYSLVLSYIQSQLKLAPLSSYWTHLSSTIQEHTSYEVWIVE